MGGILGGGAKPPVVPDTSYLDQQRRQADAQRAKVQRENDAKRRNMRARRSGRASLLFADTRGVADSRVVGSGNGLKSTLGG